MPNKWSKNAGTLLWVALIAYCQKSAFWLLVLLRMVCCQILNNWVGAFRYNNPRANSRLELEIVPFEFLDMTRRVMI